MKFAGSVLVLVAGLLGPFGLKAEQILFTDYFENTPTESAEFGKYQTVYPSSDKKSDNFGFLILEGTEAISGENSSLRIVDGISSDGTQLRLNFLGEDGRAATTESGVIRFDLRFPEDQPLEGTPRFELSLVSRSSFHNSWNLLFFPSGITVGSETINLNSNGESYQIELVFNETSSEVVFRGNELKPGRLQIWIGGSMASPPGGITPETKGVIDGFNQLIIGTGYHDQITFDLANLEILSGLSSD